MPGKGKGKGKDGKGGSKGKGGGRGKGKAGGAKGLEPVSSFAEDLPGERCSCRQTAEPAET